MQKVSRSFFYSILNGSVWFVIFLLFLNIFKIPKGKDGIFSLAYAAGHAFEFALALFIILLVLSIFPKKLHTVFAVFLGFFGTAFLVSDYIIYAQFRLHINMSMLSMFFGPASGDIFIFPTIMYIKAVFIYLSIFALAIFLWYLAGLKTTFFKKILYISALVMFLCTIGYHLAHAWASFREYNPITRQVTALPITYPLSANKKLAELGFKVPERLARFEPKLMNYPLSTIQCDNDSSKPNILIIAIDAWRFDMLTNEVSPNLKNFSEKSSLFNNHNANANHTRHGIFSLFYALPGAYWDAAVTDTISPVFMDQLLEKGYETAVYTSAAVTSPEFHKTVFSKVPNLQLKTEGKNAAERDLKITEYFLDFLDKHDKNKPFFSFLFYDSTHAYQFDEEIYPPKFLPAGVKDYSRLLDKSDATPLLNQYKNAVGYVDLLISRIFTSLEEKGYMGNTIIIITGDHAEEFDDMGKGYWGHNGNYSKYQTQVPFIFYLPDRVPATYEYETSHIDVVPTLMTNILNCNTPTREYSTGSNLFDPNPREFIYMQGDEYAIRTGNIITIFRKLGPMETVTLEYDQTNEKVSSEALKAMFEELARFKK